MKKQFIFYSIAFFCSIVQLNAQDFLCKVDSVNGVSLNKVYIKHTENSSVLLSQQPTMDGEDCLYYDKQGKIRKFISEYNYPESTFTLIAYYDLSEVLIKVLFDETQPEGCYSQGYICKTTNGKFYYNYNIYQDIVFQEQKYGHTSLIDSIDICLDFNLTNCIDAKSLLSYYKIKDAPVLDSCMVVTFIKPVIGSVAHINANKVKIRTEPNSQSETISTLNVGDKVMVVDTICGEMNYWYKISINNHGNYNSGYINGEFLEPIEKEIIVKKITNINNKKNK